MRVCVSAFLVTTKPGMQLAGVGRHMVSVLGQIAAKDYGHHFEIFIRDDVDLPPAWLSCSWITWHRIPIQNSRERILWEHFRVGKEAKKLNCDVLLSMFLPLPIGCTLPMVAIAHDAFPRTHADWYPPRKRIILDQLTRIACQKSKRLVTVSEYSRKELSKAYKVPLSKIIVSPNGLGNSVRQLNESELASIDLSKFGAENYIFTVSTVEPRKNMDGLIRAFEILKQENQFPDLKLLIAGAKGWLDSAVAQQWEASPVKNDIEFLGYVSDLELNALLQKAKHFAFPTYVEGFGIPPLEAMAAGTPVVSSNTSALPEVCGDCAEYCDPSDPSSIANAMSKLLLDSELRGRLSQCGFKQVQKFSWDESVKKLVFALEEAVN